MLKIAHRLVDLTIVHLRWPELFEYSFCDRICCLVAKHHRMIFFSVPSAEDHDASWEGPQDASQLRFLLLALFFSQEQQKSLFRNVVASELVEQAKQKHQAQGVLQGLSLVAGNLERVHH